MMRRATHFTPSAGKAGTTRGREEGRCFQQTSAVTGMSSSSSSSCTMPTGVHRPNTGSPSPSPIAVHRPSSTTEDT